MTGLLLLVADQGANPTRVLMPNVADHVGAIGFFTEVEEPYCDVHYDLVRKICYVNMEGWTLDPVGGANAAVRVPGGAVNLTRGSGKKVNVAHALTRSIGDLAFKGGQATDSCSLASWSFNPIGVDGPERLSLINVLEWVIPNLQTWDGKLTRRSRTSSTTVEVLGPLTPNADNEFELLVLHIPQAEFEELKKPPSPRAREQSEAPAVLDSAAMISSHFTAFYHTIEAQPASRRFPQRPRRLRDVCPLTILRLADAFTRDETSGRGVRTLSCILASGEAE